MRWTVLVLLGISVVPSVSLGWAHRASPDDLVEMNTDYRALRVQIELLKATGVRPITVARLLQLLGEPGAEPEAEWAAKLREKLSHEDSDVDKWIRETLPKFLDLIEIDGTRIIRNPSGSCPVATSVLQLMFDAEHQFQNAGLDYGVLGINEAATEEHQGSRLGKMLPEVESRCIEEAYDMCLDSGSVQPFIVLATEQAHTFQEFGAGEEEFLRLVAERMKDCGIYEYTGTTLSTVTHLYETAGKSETTIDSVVRGRLQLKFDSETIAGITDLTNGTVTTDAGKRLEYELPKVQCHGTNGERCVFTQTLDVAPQLIKAAMRIDGLRVKYETERAEINGPAVDDPHAPSVIRFVRYSPFGMDREVLWLLINPALIMWREYDRIGSEGPGVHRPAYTNQGPVKDWTRHGDAELDAVVFEKLIDEDYADEARADYKYHEKATLRLIHKPRNRQNPKAPAPDPPRSPANGPRG